MKLIGIATAAAMIAATAGCQNGQLNPKVVTDVNSGLALGACMWGVYSRDESKTPPAPADQVVIDMGFDCGADAANIVTLFGNTSQVGQAALSNTPKVNDAAVKYRAAHGPVASVPVAPREMIIAYSVPATVGGAR